MEARVDGSGDGEEGGVRSGGGGNVENEGVERIIGAEKMLVDGGEKGGERGLHAGCKVGG